MPPKKSKMNPAIIAALIGLAGTVVTAFLTSPVLIELIKKSGATNTPAVTSLSSTLPATAITNVVPSITPIPPNQVMVFSEDFEDGSASGFGFRSGDWKVAKDKSNRVLELTATSPEIPAAIVDFGPSEFANGIIEFRVNFVELQGMYLDFREQFDGSRYTLALSPADSVIVWASNIFNGSEWAFSPIGPGTSQPFTFQADTWYLVRLEARGGAVNVSVDGNRTLSGSNDLFASGSLRFALSPGAVIYLDDVKVWSFE